MHSSRYFKPNAFQHERTAGMSLIARREARKQEVFNNVPLRSWIAVCSVDKFTASCYR
ncbi:MAG: hypothetical protein ACKO5X_09210 [Limnohabitans sp.]